MIQILFNVLICMIMIIGIILLAIIATGLLTALIEGTIKFFKKKEK